MIFLSTVVEIWPECAILRKTHLQFMMYNLNHYTPGVNTLVTAYQVPKKLIRALVTLYSLLDLLLFFGLLLLVR